MHARVTRSESTPDRVDAVVKLVRETVVPNASKLQGFKGGYWLVDRSAGKGFGVTLFESEAALRATEDAAAQLRAKAAGTTNITGVERYEVVGHAAAPQPVGAARVTKFEGPTSKIADMIKYTNESIIPAAKKISGFKGGYWLLDRQTGKGFSLTLFESDAALQTSEEGAAKIRTQAATDVGVTITGVERYEVIAQVAEPAMATR